MPLLIDKHDNPLIFIHIPKTGGTSLKSMLGPDIKVIFDDEFKKDLPCPPQHFHIELLKRLGVLTLASKQLAIVRHPISRFTSEYSYRRKVDKKFRSIGLTGFTYFVLNAWKHNPYILSNHIRPQMEFVDDSTFIYRLEQGLEKVCADYPNYFQTQTESIPRNNTSNSELIEIDHRTLAFIVAFYKSDMEYLGYNETDIVVIKESFIKHTIEKIVGYTIFCVYRLLTKIKLIQD